jgi:type IX secretion system substrate protein
MKKILLIALIAFVTNAKAQFTLEHDYPSASTYAGNQLMMINFEVSGDQYVFINRGAKNITIYSMSHALVKTISLASLPIGIGSGTIDDVLYLSQHLFNSDTLIEFVYVKDGDSPTQSQVFVYNESGTILFSDSAGMPIRNNIPTQQYPIYNTPSNGTKMILSYPNGHAKVWGLAGTLTTAIDRVNHTASLGLGNAYPNPTANTITIPYTLPQGTTQGELVFYDVQGVAVKRFKVDNTFSTLLISTTDIPSGTYYYQLLINGNASAAKKMVVVK